MNLLVISTPFAPNSEAPIPKGQYVRRENSQWMKNKAPINAFGVASMGTAIYRCAMNF